MEILGPILELLQIIWSPIRDCWSYYRDLDDNMGNLRRTSDGLSGRKQALVARINPEKTTERLTRKETNPEIKKWFDRVESINVQVQHLEQDYKKVKCSSRACLGKRVCKKIKEVQALHDRGNFTGPLVVPATSTFTMPAVEVFGETAKRKMQEIWDALMDDRVRKIGVHGMGGIGKTNIAKKIFNRLREHQREEAFPFRGIIWVTASEAFSLSNLQKEVANALDRYEKDFSKYEDETTRAAMLCAILDKKDKWVLILDDMWEPFELGHIGIPEPTLDNGCKLLLTTREVAVCRSMGCKEIRVERLTEEEAWNLFLERAGHDVLRDWKIEKLAKEVANHCACLPLAIITMATGMKGADIHEWRHLLRELKKSTKGHGSKDKVLNHLKLSYNRLNDITLQRCLQYCAFYPKSFEIEREELITYLIAEGIIEHDSRQDEFDYGRTLLNRLVNASLLEIGSKGTKYVSMHDLVRDMAIQIMTMREGDLVESGKQLIEWPGDEKYWKRKPKRASLMNNGISEVPPILPSQFQSLQTLLLARNEPLVTIPDSFFSNMLHLMVLDLSYTGIEVLPSSISDMAQLTALFLRHCKKLRMIPSLVKLLALRELDLRYTGIKELPEGFEMPINLRSLNLCIPDLETLPFGMLSKLSRLQCLIVWLGSETLKVNGKELLNLRNLKIFEGQLDNLLDFNAYVRDKVDEGTNDQGLDEYILKLGPKEWQEDQGHRKVIILIEYIADEAALLPVDVECLNILRCQNLRLIYASSLKTNDEFSSHEIVVHNATLFVPFPSYTHIAYGKRGPANQPGAFSLLKILNIESCHDVEGIFGLLPPLQHLEEFSIYDCQHLKEILSTAVAEKYEAEVCAECSSSSNQQHHSAKTLVFELPKLRVLSLTRLPELRSICPGLIYCPSIVFITITYCPKLKTLPLAPHIDDSSHPLPDLNGIYLQDEIWWESLEWHLPNFKEVLQPFCKFLNPKFESE